jgi:hypothetical protein
MRNSKPPALATWLLEHFRSGSRNEYITGDLMEAYQTGYSRAWYWKQVLAAIVVSLYQEITAYPVLALRAIAVGMGTWFIYRYGVAPRLLSPLIRRFLQPSGFPFSPWGLTWWTLSLTVSAASGWIIARLDRPHRTGMVLVFATFSFFLQLKRLPWLWFDGANTLTNIRFVPYLLNNLAALTLPSLAILFGGLWGASPESEPKRQEQRPTP